MILKDNITFVGADFNRTKASDLYKLMNKLNPDVVVPLVRPDVALGTENTFYEEEEQWLNLLTADKSQ